MQIEVIECNTEVAMETQGKCQIWTPNLKKWRTVGLIALLNQNIVEQLKENAKNKNMLKATQTC